MVHQKSYLGRTRPRAFDPGDGVADARRLPSPRKLSLFILVIFGQAPTRNEPNGTGGLTCLAGGQLIDISRQTRAFITSRECQRGSQIVVQETPPKRPRRKAPSRRRVTMTDIARE